MPAETGNGIEKTGGGLPFFVTIAVTVVLVGLTAYAGIMFDLLPFVSPGGSRVFGLN